MDTAAIRVSRRLYPAYRDAAITRAMKERLQQRQRTKPAGLLDSLRGALATILAN